MLGDLCFRITDKAKERGHHMELTVCYADEHEMKFGFIGQEELLAVAQAISRCIL